MKGNFVETTLVMIGVAIVLTALLAVSSLSGGSGFTAVPVGTSAGSDSGEVQVDVAGAAAPAAPAAPSVPKVTASTGNVIFGIIGG